MVQAEILGTSTVTDRWRISLLKRVRESFEAEGVDIDIGDQVVYKVVDGRVVIEPA